MSSTYLSITDQSHDLIRDLKDVWTEAYQKQYEDWALALRRLPGFLEDDIDPLIDLPPEAPQQQIVTTINLCYRNYLAFLARSVPRFRKLQGVAASREPRDLRAAYSVQRMLRAEMLGHKGRHADEILRMISFVFCCHTAFMLVEGIVPKGKTFGEVKMTAYSPFDIFFWPGVKRLADSPAVVLTERLTRQEIRSRWGDVPMKLDGASWPEKARMADIAKGIDRSLVEVNRLFIKPCDEFPRGAQRIVLADSHEDLFKATLPDDPGQEWIGSPDDEYQIVSVGDVPLGHLDYGQSRMGLIQGPQKVYNTAYSRHVQAVKEMPVITILAPDTSGLTPATYHNRTVALMNYRAIGGHQPKIEVTPSPQITLETMAWSKQIIEDMHAQSPVSRGQAQGTRMPVGTFQGLVERSEDQDHVLIERLKDGVATIAERVAIEGRNVWPKRKVYLTLGAHRRFESAEFYKADLKEGFSVRIQPDNGMPKSAEARWDKVIKGTQAGVFGPANDPATSEKSRKLLEILDEEEEFALGHIDEQRAYEDFLLLKEGREAPVSLFDNHAVHIKTETQYAVEEMTATQQALPPDLEERLTMHRLQHIEKQQESNAHAVAMQGMPQPQAPETPPAEGAPGGPLAQEIPPEAQLAPEIPAEGGPPAEIGGIEQMSEGTGVPIMGPDGGAIG